MVTHKIKGSVLNCSARGDVPYASSVMGHMGPIKSFGDLQDSIMKLRENFDAIVLGKF